ncbi:aspartyl/glutamyl-tRNA(Asn/Gln) amidotransferase subunit C [Chitiniphilus shinanonensis]|uniref:Aspartyl/glutamyl-tRNA(Asn/Gln) amidotransferase subunit C n=1 Tax=Chitiniphilus shinanonensis TaxID=553088 RepID=A0ABQ6BQ46_9NEIS|nr:Asp-tRNA(Asn)/Glu-tRNA(Gln) amidotransferase subunit GatC [Chitiniphilus shinanonensis]GLS03559.1 aspartyl/glutamyl-tRNA(Asn/Gln) amidotransferase subunit C [Chitiniphilus shinanonensis]
MSLSLDDVKRIARLSRIAVTDDELAATQTQLNRIFGLIEEMRAVDTTGIEPMSHAQDVVLRLRDDAATAPNRREAFQAVAPAVEDGLYLVPKVIE